MPALTSPQSAAAIIGHMQVELDATIGIQDGETGLILTSTSIDPSRTVKEKMDHEGRDLGALFTTPKYTLGLEYETTIKTALIPSAHPGTALTLAEVNNFNADTQLGFPTDGFLSVRSQKRGGRSGDFYTGSTTLQLCFLATSGAYVVRAA
jgi:hypothetical protein